MAISTEFIELRNEPRISVQPTTICVEVEGPEGGADGTWENGILVDRASRGAGLLLDRPYCPGRILRLLGLPGAGTHEAQVRWVRKTHSHYRVGVEFL
jgi:hypothetical protein